MEVDEQIKNLIAEKAGVPADVLRGDSVEELAEHASAIADFLAPPSAPIVASDGYGMTELRQPPSSDWLRDAIFDQL